MCFVVNEGVCDLDCWVVWSVWVGNWVEMCCVGGWDWYDGIVCGVGEVFVCGGGNVGKVGGLFDEY